MDRFEDVVPIENGSTVYSIAMLGYHRVYIYENVSNLDPVDLFSEVFPNGSS